MFSCRVFCVSILLIVLTACGGGGGSEGGVTTPSEPVIIDSSLLNASDPSTFVFSALMSDELSELALTWDFGDGSGGRSVGASQITHSYLAVGLYSVTASYDLAGLTESVAMNVVVGESVSLSLAGEISSLTNTVIDGDVNDPNVPYVDNNSLSSSQSVPPISVISGFVSDAGTGGSGDRFSSTADPRDYYQVDLEAGQALFLEIAAWSELNADNNDFDLILYNAADEQELDSSVGVNKTELLSIEQAGSYIIEVNSYSGSGNYTLRLINQSELGFLPASKHMSTQQNFAIGQAVVTFNADAQQRAVALTRLSDASLLQQSQEMGLYQLTNAQPRVNASSNAEYVAKRDTLESIKRLNSEDNINASPNYYYQALALSNDSLVERQWHYPQINLAQAWALQQEHNLSDVVVAVIDTGIYQQHSDLRNQLTSDGYDFISDASNAGDGDGFDSNPNDPGDQANPDGSSSWHGTHVAGTIAAQTNNSGGVAGVAPNAQVMNLRALGRFGGSTWDISQAMLYAAGLDNASDQLPTVSADIINMSLGGEGYDSSFDRVTQRVIDAGVIVIAAAGNSSTNRSSYPAAFDRVIGVSALDAGNRITSYSNYGSYIDIAAPGGDTSQDLNGDGYGDGIYSTYVDESGSSLRESYTYLNGTSMAAPHVAGVAALMKQLQPDLSPAQFETMLVQGHLSSDLGSAGRDNSYGYGLLDAEKAVQAVTIGIDPDQSYLKLNISQLYLSSQLNTNEFVVSKIGSEPISVESVTESSSWLTVAPVEVDNESLGTYQVSVDRSGLSDGTYTADIVITSSDSQSLTLSVAMVVSNIQADDSGVVYVILRDGETGDTLAMRTVTMNDRVFSYRFSGIVPGVYSLVAGTDHNNDQYLCDEGELCGAYPVLAETQEIILLDSDSDYNFILEPMTTEDLTSQGVKPLSLQ